MLSWRIQAAPRILVHIVNPENELNSAARPEAPGVAARRSSMRGPFVTTLAAGAVVAFAGAMLAPAGSAIADPSANDDTVTVYSLAAADTQNLTVTVEGGSIEPETRGTFEVYVTPKPTPTPTQTATSTSTSTQSSTPSTNTAVSAPQYTGGGSKEQWMSAAGIAAGDWGYVDYIVSRESGWNPNATNPSSGACGLVQVYPCSKLADARNPVVNLSWANGYAIGRYGSWAQAYSFWTRNHWW